MSLAYFWSGLVNPKFQNPAVDADLQWEDGTVFAGSPDINVLVRISHPTPAYHNSYCFTWRTLVASPMRLMHYPCANTIWSLCEFDCAAGENTEPILEMYKLV